PSRRSSDLGNEDVDASGAHVYPDRARGNTVEHHQAAHFVYRICHLADVVVGQHQARGRFHVRGKDHGGFFLADGGHDVLNGCRREGCGRLGARAPCLQHGAGGRDLASFKDLRPAVAEPAVADHQHTFATGKLARDSFHAIGATTGYYCHSGSLVDLLEVAADIAHYLLELLRHVVQRAVGEYHGKF